MLISLIVSGIFNFLYIVFDLLPSLPPISETISSAGAGILSVISNVAGILQMVYGQVLFSAIFTLVLVLINFEWVYHTILWILKKIPVLGIK